MPKLCNATEKTLRACFVSLISFERQKDLFLDNQKTVCDVSVYILHTKAKTWVFAVNFSAIWSAMALPIVPKVEFIFEIMLYITIFLYKSPRSCFKSATGIQNSLEIALMVSFSRQLKEGKSFHQKSLMTQYTLIFHSQAFFLFSVNAILFTGQNTYTTYNTNIILTFTFTLHYTYLHYKHYLQNI